MPGPAPKASYRYDPYRNYRFRLKWDGKYVAGISKVSALTRTTQVITRRSGGDPATPRRMPGQSDYVPITLERGVTHDLAFQQWVNKVWDYSNADPAASLQDFRKDVMLELYNEAGMKVMAYNIYRCWPSEFTGLPELDANSNAVAIQSLTLQHEGWERDISDIEPEEPSFRLPSSS